MSLFEFLNNGRLFLLSKKKVKINDVLSSCIVSEEFIVNDIPYHLLKKQVVQINCHNGILEIYVREGS